MLRHADLVSIGAHVYGGEFNSASVIGKYGNPYNDYLAAFSLPKISEGLNLIPVTGPAAVEVAVGAIKDTSTSLAPAFTHTGTYLNDGAASYQSSKGRSGLNGLAMNGRSQSNTNELSRSSMVSGAKSHELSRSNLNKLSGSSLSMNRSNPRPQAILTYTSNHENTQHLDSEEGFFDFIKDALRVGAPFVGNVLKTGLPLALGPLGGPIGALAGVALNAAGKLAETTDAESSFDMESIHDGSIEKAILGEAALTTIQSMDLHPEDEESIFSDMKDYIVKAAPTVTKVAPHIMGAMMEPALRIALSSLHTYNEKGVSGAEAFGDEAEEPFRYSPPVPTGQLALDPASKDFLQGFRSAVTHNQESFGDESEEGFFDIIQTGLSFVANTGIPLLAKVLSPESADAESFEASAPVAAPMGLSADDLGKRALAGEAALHAIMKLPQQTLEEEGIFDTILEGVKKIAPIVLKVAPAVISSISPTVGNILKAATGQDATFVTQGQQQQQGRNLPRRQLNERQNAPSLRKKQSTGNFLGKVKQHQDQGSRRRL